MFRRLQCRVAQRGDPVCWKTLKNQFSRNRNQVDILCLRIILTHEVPQLTAQPDRCATKSQIIIFPEFEMESIFQVFEDFPPMMYRRPQRSVSSRPGPVCYRTLNKSFFQKSKSSRFSMFSKIFHWCCTADRQLSLAPAGRTGMSIIFSRNRNGIDFPYFRKLMYRRPQLCVVLSLDQYATRPQWDLEINKDALKISHTPVVEWIARLPCMQEFQVPAPLRKIKNLCVFSYIR